MTKFRYIPRMHRELRRACPEGYYIRAIREGKRLLTAVSCDDRDYFEPWLVSEIVFRYGFGTFYA